MLKAQTLVLLALLHACAFASAVHAEIKTQVVEYKHGDVVLEGFLAYDSAVTGDRPGVLIVHQWMGITDHERGKAVELAKLGYVAFACDIYGKGVRPDNPKDAGATAGSYKKNIPLFRDRVNLGLSTLKAFEHVDKSRTGAIGFCFGGTAVLELARSGAEVNGVVSFHGGLGTTTPEDARNIKGKVLVCHGADDPFVPDTEVLAFQKEMRDAKVDWALVSYGNSVHSFTQPAAGNDNSKGAAYNETAAKRSWSHMKAFFEELFTK